MAVEFLDPLAKRGKHSNIPDGICWLDLVVLVEWADLYSIAVLTPDCSVWRVVRSAEKKHLLPPQLWNGERRGASKDPYSSYV